MKVISVPSATVIMIEPEIIDDVTKIFKMMEKYPGSELRVIPPIPENLPVAESGLPRLKNWYHYAWNLPYRVANLVHRAGITPDKLYMMSKDDILKIDKIGSKSFDAIDRIRKIRSYYELSGPFLTP